MIAAMVCREMGWTWQEYEAQPAVFIEIIIEMIRAENKEIERRSKKDRQP